MATHRADLSPEMSCPQCGEQIEESEIFVGDPPEPGNGAGSFVIHVEPEDGELFGDSIWLRQRTAEVLVGEGWLGRVQAESQIVSFGDDPVRCARHWWTISEKGREAIGADREGLLALERPA